MPAAVVDFVFKRAEGNPLYTAELFGQVVRLLKLSKDESSYEVEGDLESLLLPTSLHDAIRANFALQIAPSAFNKRERSAA